MIVRISHVIMEEPAKMELELTNVSVQLGLPGLTAKKVSCNIFRFNRVAKQLFRM